MKKIAFTLCSNNYLAQAKTLGVSFLANNPEYSFSIGLVDKKNDLINYEDYNKFNLILVETVKDLPLEYLSSNYNIVEFNTAVKPYFFAHFLAEDYDIVHYLDPDIEVFSKFTELDSILMESNIVLTPHITTPTGVDGKFPDESWFIMYGIYNLGYIGVANNTDSKIIIEWWKEKVYHYCKMGSGLFVDQKWINLVPLLFPKVHVLKNPGYNMAYWNFHERTLKLFKGSYIINDNYPLVFFHFSQYDPIKGILAKRQNRWVFGKDQVIDDLYENYKNKLLKYGYNDIINVKSYYTDHYIKQKRKSFKQSRWVKTLYQLTPSFVLRYIIKMSKAIVRHEKILIDYKNPFLGS